MWLQLCASPISQVTTSFNFICHWWPFGDICHSLSNKLLLCCWVDYSRTNQLCWSYLLAEGKMFGWWKGNEAYMSSFNSVNSLQCWCVILYWPPKIPFYKHQFICQMVPHISSCNKMLEVVTGSENGKVPSKQSKLLENSELWWPLLFNIAVSWIMKYQTNYKWKIVTTKIY